MPKKQKTLNGNVIELELYDEKGHKVDTIRDFCTGKELKRTPEEEVRQLLEKKLVLEYGYAKEEIAINFMIQKGSTKIGPADIVVFRSSRRKTFDNIFLICETKREERTDGIDQLKTYLAPTPAEGGIWFNGKEIVYLRVIRKPPTYHPQFVFWRNIPKKGQSWDEIGIHKTLEELVPASDLRSTFKVIHYHLYTNSNIPRAEKLGAEMTRLIFCKIFDEIHNPDNLQFKASANESDKNVADRIKKIFEKVKKEYPDVFYSDERIFLDDKSISYVVSQLQDISLIKTDKDAVGDAFEVFIGPGLRGEKGQFFTPRNVVRMTVEMLDIEPGERVIDPACGSGGFLIVALEYVWKKIEQKYRHLPSDVITQKKVEVATKFFFGIDKEFDLAKVSKAYMAIIGDGRGGIFCADSLLPPEDWPSTMKNKVKLGTFDVVLTNPPFGAKIPIKDKNILAQYDLGYNWKFDKNAQKWVKINTIRKSQVPQVLFIERCLQLLKPGGRMGIVLPDGILGNKREGYIREFIKQNAKILAIVDCPPETFQPSVPTKTSVVFLQKKKSLDDEEDYPIFMAIAKKCGHNRRGTPIFKVLPNGEVVRDDDFPLIAKAYKKFREEQNVYF